MKTQNQIFHTIHKLYKILQNDIIVITFVRIPVI